MSKHYSIIDDDPPTYEEAVKALYAAAPPNPTAQQLLDAGSKIPESTAQVLAEHSSDIPDMSPNQQTTFALGMAAGMSSTDGADKLEIAARAACNACNDIETMFTDLYSNLTSIDIKYKLADNQALAPKLDVIHTVC
jgi:hypothetical protein